MMISAATYVNFVSLRQYQCQVNKIYPVDRSRPPDTYDAAARGYLSLKQWRLRRQLIDGVIKDVAYLTRLSATLARPRRTLADDAQHRRPRTQLPESPDFARTQVPHIPACKFQVPHLPVARLALTA